MKTKTFFLIAFLTTGLIANMFGQSYDTIRVAFTAQYEGEHVSLDSILVMNLTQDSETMLYAPDTSLLLIWLDVGMNEHDLIVENSFSVSPNYPNPFVGQTSIDVSIVKADRIQIRIYDLSGRLHALHEGIFDAGKHTFMFYPDSENFYIFSVTYCGLTRSVKIANSVSGNQDCKVAYKGFVNKTEEIVNSHKQDNFPFVPGDNLRYIGYAKAPDMRRGSDFTEDAPHADTSYMFDISIGIPCIDVPTVSYNMQLYNTLQIGTQCWLKENLNVGTMVPGVQGQVNNGLIEKYCYDDDPAKCIIYGGLYQWDEMMQYSTQVGIQGICPPDWHIPADEEWKQLEGEVDSQYGYPDPEWDTLDYRGYDVGEKLKSTTTWEVNGTDHIGFSALATGGRHWEGWFASEHIYTSFWSSEEINSTESWYRYLEYWTPKMARYPRMQAIGRSVRCLKDE